MILIKVIVLTEGLFYFSFLVFSLHLCQNFVRNIVFLLQLYFLHS